MKKHKPNCLIFICTCGESVEEEKYMKKQNLKINDHDQNSRELNIDTEINRRMIIT